ncbi:MAG: helix-turn-helix transcriptional regulator [Marinirhabdus sp.]|nr:helix-turn-helix transcriptional regulator [Marinirhabdus sp.]
MKYSPSRPQLHLISSPPNQNVQHLSATENQFVDLRLLVPDASPRMFQKNDNIRYLNKETRTLKKVRGFIAVCQRWEKELFQLGITKEKLESITEQEENIIQQIANGQQTKDIAESLFISEHTVQTHRKNINKKLGISSAVTLVKVSMLLSLSKG